MTETRTAISLRLPPELLAELDVVRNEFDFPPTRTAVIESLLKDFVANINRTRRLKKNENK